MKTALALRHVAFEDLAAFAPVLQAAGYDIRYHDVGVDPWPPEEPDLLVVLGGPIGVYEEAIYPFLRDETAFIADRLAAKRPTLGICLGAQLMAAALGARVYPGPAKEIGWGAIALTEAGKARPLASLAGVPVLHWHGDTFDLPADAVLLGSTAICKHQAFAIGDHALAFQFHPEQDGQWIERWLIGHTAELAAGKFSVPELRAESARLGAAAGRAGRACLEAWLRAI